jgi:hypothetical protein
MLVAVIATTALAAKKTYEGTVGDNGSVEFKLKTKSGAKPKVVGFEFDGLDGTCSQGLAHITGEFKDPKKVKNDKFTLKNDRGTFTEVAKGTIDGAQASGTLQVSGDLAPGVLDDCETGKVAWTASR